MDNTNPRPQQPLASKHIASPVRKAIVQAVKTGSQLALAKAVDTLPELSFIATPLLIGTRTGAGVEILGVWSKLHIQDFLLTLDNPPRLHSSQRSVYTASDDVRKVLGHDAALDHAKTYLPGDAGPSPQILGQLFEIEHRLDLPPLSDVECEHLMEAYPHLVIPDDLFPEFEEPEPVTMSGDKTVNAVLTVIKRAEMRSIQLGEAHIRHFCSRRNKPYLNALGELMEKVSATVLPAYLVNAEPRWRGIVLEATQRGHEDAVDSYGRIAALMMADPKAGGVFEPDEQFDVEALARALPPRFADYGSLLINRANRTLWFPDTDNPLGMRGVLFARFFLRGDTIQMPSAYMRTPKAMARGDFFNAFFLGSKSSDEPNQFLSFKCRLTGSVAAEINDPYNYSTRLDGPQEDPALFRKIAAFGLDMLYRHTPSIEESFGVGSDAEWKQHWKELAESDPVLCEKIAPQRFCSKNGYAAPARIHYTQAVMAKSAILTQQQGAIEDLRRYAGIAAAAQYGNQIFHVTESLSQVLNLTDFNPESEMISMEWPFDALTFSFNEKSPCGKCAITLAKLLPGKEYQLDSLAGAIVHGPAFRVKEAAIVVMVMHEAGASLTGSEGGVLRLKEVEEIAEPYRLIVSLGFKALLFLRHFPSSVQTGVQLRNEKVHGERVVREGLWSARQLSIPRIKETEGIRNDLARSKRHDRSGAKVRPHWRKGHDRTQRYGPGLIHAKELFIWPVYVNAPDGTAAE